MQIIIKGKPKDGKSTVGLIIEQALRSNGLSVTFTDIDGDLKFVKKTLRERIDYVKNNLEIFIVENNDKTS